MKDHLTLRDIPRSIFRTANQSSALAKSQGRPAFVAVWPINRQAVALKPMEPVHLFSLEGPNRVKRVRIHVFVHPKVQLLQGKLMPPDARPICTYQGGF